MQTTILDVGGMISALDHRGIERQLKQVRGVYVATVNIATNTAVIEYDETVTSVAALKDKINECGFHCAGQIVPKHICKPHAGHVHDQGMHAGHAAALT